MASSLVLPAAAMLGCLVVEALITRTSIGSRDIWKRRVVNVVSFALQLGFGLLLLRLMAFAPQRSELGWRGLLGNAPFPHAVNVALGVFAIDLIFYVGHRLSHELPFLWRLHRVHHSDQHVDATTALRFHPLQPLVDRVVAVVGFVGIFGVPVESFAIYGAYHMWNSYLQHSRLLLPARLERWLGWVVITPRAHLIHHSPRIEETNSNYSFCLSIWDRLFGTYRMDMEVRPVGLPEFADPHWQTLWGLLKTPFVTPIASDHDTAELQPSAPRRAHLLTGLGRTHVDDTTAPSNLRD
jgi:sterol desaturase/sphingolipid hydroxylase (fatty acid hydroxylase superfamily)